MKYVDYYRVLGVERTAGDKEIKSAYRRLARQYHPDLHQGEEKRKAEEKFKQINEAYEVLSDPEKRRRYDQFGANWQNGQEFDPRDFGFQGVKFDFGNLGGSDFSEFFRMMFGNVSGGGFDFGGLGVGTRRRGPVHGEDIEAELKLTVGELMAGGEREIAVNGDGHRRLMVKLSNKLYNGAVLRLKGQGGEGWGGAPAGDLLLRVKLVDDNLFRVVGQNDIECDLTVYPDQVALGDVVRVNTPHGVVQVTIKPGMRAGQRLRLAGKGVRKKDGGFGDLYLRLVIDLPHELSEQERNLYREIRRLRG
ncbi:MAG: J domain-containing protein [Negativicutes bacterium]|nr:J domain-containing protein [Negativicutes bacterium]